MRMGQGVRTGLGHGGITCVLQTPFLVIHMLDEPICHFTNEYCLTYMDFVGRKLIICKNT